MDRKEFLRNSLLATGAILLPNAIWAFDKNFNAKNRSLNKFVSKPNLKRFKASELGTKFFETELSIIKPKTDFKLHRKFFISENLNGICTPTLLETHSKESFVFIPELYKDKKHNGFIVKVCENGLCEETKVFTHENQGYYAFWGKEYLGNPTLYHYNIETFHLMRMHQENGNWINHRVMPIYPNEMIALYKQQLQQVERRQLTQQFGYDFEIQKDGFYQFLSLKNDCEQSIITKEKEIFEKENPAKVYNTANELITQSPKETEFSYTNPFVPIWCEDDDYSHAITKPTIFYREVVGTKIEIENMPAYKTQDDLGDCKAFSLAAILQQYVNTKWKSDIPDPKNPPSDMAISHFGLMAYTNRSRYNGENLEELLAKGYSKDELNIKGLDYSLQFLQENGRNMEGVIDDLSKNGNSLILENCKPFENLTKEFSLKGSKGLEKRDEFINYLKEIFQNLKNSTEQSIKDCTQEINTLNKFVNLNFNQNTLKKALTKNNFDQFLYTLFFNECKMENFPSGFRSATFPLDSMDVTFKEVKEQIIKGLKYGKPVLFPSLVMYKRSDGEIADGGTHSLVISGFKRVKNLNVTKDVFKLHNSWGVEWQNKNNDGWVDADVFVQNTAQVKKADGSYRIGSACVTWLA